MASFSTLWHGRKPQMTGSGTVNYSISGTTVTVSGTLSNVISESGGSYGFSVGYKVTCGSNSESGDVTHNSGSGSTSFSYSFNMQPGNFTISVYYICGQTGGCQQGYPCVCVYSVSIYVPDPYSAFSLGISSVVGRNGSNDIGKVGTDTWRVYYTLNGGTDGIIDCRLRLYGGSSLIKEVSIGTSKSSSTQSATFTLSTSQFSHGSTYKVSVWASDGTTAKETSALSFHTFTEPTISSTVATSKVSFPTNANTANTFYLPTVNNRVHSSSLEADFQTRYRTTLGTTVSSFVSLGNITTWSRTEAQMRTLVPKAYDGVTCHLTFDRYSPTPDWSSTNAAGINLILYYRPRMAVSDSSVSYKSNDKSGSSIARGSYVTNTSTFTDVYVSWSYDSSKPDAGYVQGYRVRLYNHNKTLVNTYYTTTTYITIPKADIPRVYITYIDITPYYGNDMKGLADSSYASNYWYYEGTVSMLEFIKLVTELSTPSITYPITGSDWINDDFRVCFKLPEDPDYSYIEETYSYENLELMVNSTVFSFTSSDGTTSGSKVTNNIFSTTTLSYIKAIVAFPNYSDIFNSSSYSMKIRVKKKYGATSSLQRWSSWSSAVIITKTVPSFSVNKYDLILADHYNGAYNTVDRARSTYGVSWTNAPGKVIKNSTIIKASQYSQSTIMHIINDTKSQVNNYATFDSGRDYVKFDYTDKLPTTFNETVGELITADKNEGNEPNGRNYIHFIYDRCKLLM